MSNQGDLIYVVLIVTGMIAVGASSLGIVACLVGMRSREVRVRRWVALLVTTLLSLPLAAVGAVGGHYLASFNGIGFAADFGLYYGCGTAAAVAAVAGFTVGRLLSRPQRSGAKSDPIGPF